MSVAQRPARLGRRRMFIILIVVLGGLTALPAIQAVRYWRGSWHSRKSQTAIAMPDFRAAQQQLDACRGTWPNDAETAFLATRAARKAGDLPAGRCHVADARRLQTTTRRSVTGLRPNTASAPKPWRWSRSNPCHRQF